MSKLPASLPFSEFKWRIEACGVAEYPERALPTEDGLGQKRYFKRDMMGFGTQHVLVISRGDDYPVHEPTIRQCLKILQVSAEDFTAATEDSIADR